VLSSIWFWLSGDATFEYFAGGACADPTFKRALDMQS
jgi:hypothetical protein